MELAQIVAFLKSKYIFHGAILYGSRAGNDFRDNSDYDLICINDGGPRTREIIKFEDIAIDLIIEDEKILTSQLPHVSLYQSLVLLDEKGSAKRLVDDSLKIISTPPPPMPASRIHQRKKQILDSLLYIQQPDTLGDYRKHDLMPKLLSLYLSFTNQWDLGDKHTFQWLKKNDPKTFGLFKEALKKDATFFDIEALALHIHSL